MAKESFAKVYTFLHLASSDLFYGSVDLLIIIHTSKKFYFITFNLRDCDFPFDTRCITYIPLERPYASNTME